MVSITLHVNGQLHTVDVHPEMPLLWVLRDLLGLTGTKYGCGAGTCGACTVHQDGEAITACTTPVSQVGDSAITTIEGLGGNNPLQNAWITENVPQCGYCQPGQIMTAAALLVSNPNPDDNTIDEAMAHNLCRCGTYQRIRRAIHRAAQQEGSAT
ncbi:MAG TPA: (2Fe-2S)-binding protein [Aggregatilineales bacterium]|nr:(2Fe-2S)-binding protein [Aggregatilineales bacterium]